MNAIDPPSETAFHVPVDLATCGTNSQLGLDSPDTKCLALPFHRSRVRSGKAELPVQVVRIGGVQKPAEVSARAVLDHFTKQGIRQPAATMLGEDIDISQVCQGDAVGDSTSESDHLPVPVVAADDSPCAVNLPLHILNGTPATPVRLARQELPHRVGVDPRWIVVDLVRGVSDHKRTF